MSINIEADEEEYLYTDKSNLENAGIGLFTAIDIFKHEIIAYYLGTILSTEEAKEKSANKLDQYFIEMLDGTILDSRDVECFAKYANDASYKSSLKNNAKIGLDDENKVCLIAIKNIKSGHEILCSYGKKYWKKHG